MRVASVPRSAVISLARALSFNGLANGFRVAAINGGSHVGPTFGGDTIYAWSEILEKSELPQRTDIGALRVRTIATKDCPCSDFPGKGADGKEMKDEGKYLEVWKKQGDGSWKCSADCWNSNLPLPGEKG